MSAEAHITNTGVDNRKFAMWTLIASECFLFGTLLVTYLINRNNVMAGPGGPDIFDINLTTISTFVLLMSSVAMVMALHYCLEKNLRRMQAWLAVVAIGGIIFLGFQYYEFYHFVNEGLKFNTSPFASSFYLLTGCHGLHVAVGVLWISSLLVTSLKRGEAWFDDVIIETAGLYWHFVDVVWIVLFTVVYLFVYV